MKPVIAASAGVRGSPSKERYAHAVQFASSSDSWQSGGVHGMMDTNGLRARASSCGLRKKEAINRGNPGVLVTFHVITTLSKIFGKIVK